MQDAPLDVIVPGPLDTLTGGYVYDRRTIEALRQRGHGVNVHEIAGGWPWPDESTCKEAAELLKSIPDDRLVLIDGLAYGAMPDIVAKESRRLALMALVHHPLALEGGSTASDTARLRNGETRALSHAMHVFTTSPATTNTLIRDYAVPSERISTIPPGTDAAPCAVGSIDTTFNLLCVATLTPRKGHDILLDALADLNTHEWRLRCVGSATRSPATAAALHKRIEHRGLGDRVTLTGELDDRALAQLWHEADLFVLASRFEGYGMVFDEALAHGLPIIASGAGAVQTTVPAAVGLTVPPDDLDAFRTALAQWFEQPALRNRLRTGARRARTLRRDWLSVGTDYSEVFERLTRRVHTRAHS